MIKSVTAINPKGEKLEIQLTRPDLAGIAVTKIEGLGPPTADINCNDVATMDGGIFESSRMTNREIKIELTMITSSVTPTIEDSRRLAYRFFQIKKPVTLQIQTDRLYVEAYGYVKSNTPDIFSEREKANVTIICPDPYFYEVGEERHTFSGIMPLFEFPFSNESLDSDEILMSELLEDTRTIIDYDGDVDTGVRIVIHAKGPAKNITLYNIDTYEKIILDTDKIKTLTGVDFDFPDDIEIVTITGQKSIRYLHNGVYTNIITAIDRDTDWFKISNGKNIFAYVAEEGEKDVLVTFYYKNAYGGV